MKSKIYLIDYWVPFPSSMGGVCTVIAQDDNECFLLLKAEVEENRYDDELKLAIENADTFELANSDKSRVGKVFLA